VGNIEDMTLRSLRVLRQSPVIICEDPRVTDKLLKLHDIRGDQQYIQIIKSHNFNLSQILHSLKTASYDNTDVAVVTDAGTPGISDPGFEIIAILQEEGIEYTVLPGATSIIPAVVASGIVSKGFTFVGFLPIKKGRQKAWNSIIRSQYPSVLMESVHRIDKLISEINTRLEPDRRVFVAREISKKFEQFKLSSAGELTVDDIKTKGEFVVIIDSAAHQSKSEEE
jgi:16S rRNA (cytidine1402-2'-O)-methyltransferase